MSAVIVTEPEEGWINDVSGAEIVDPRDYLTDPAWNNRRGVKVYNLARSYRYQSLGYYVSLLAEARGHRPHPNVTTLQDLTGRAAVRLVPQELEELIDRSFQTLVGDEFTLSVYFGRNLAVRYDRLARELYNQFQAPLLRFEFSRRKTWRLRNATAIGARDVPAEHWPFVVQSARRHFQRGTVAKPKRNSARFDLAILHNPDEGDLAPSDPKALSRMIKAAAAVGLAAELVTRQDSGRLLEFDALFIRETTAVNHHTYRLSRLAESEGLVVIDDPLSILRCTNKVFLAELMERHKIPTPPTVVAHRRNASQIAAQLGLPCVLKRPDSAFSKGVVKVKDEDELCEQLKEFFADSELVVAQKYMRTDFDWRIGILDGRPLFACKYHMAPGHWQIIHHEGKPHGRFGKFDTLPVEMAPRKAVGLAQKAAGLIGHGFYGVDIKEADGKFYVIEVNDNPNLDAGVEDQVLREELYRRLMETFLRRIERRKAGEQAV